MIEIFAIYKLCKLLGRQLRAKGRKPLRFQFLFVLLWFVFEFLGMFIGAVLFATPGGGGASIYTCALAGAGGAAALMFFIVHTLSPVGPLQSRGFPVEVGTVVEVTAGAPENQNAP